MVEKLERILLVDHNKSWAERFVNALQIRGWNIFWTMDAETIYDEDLYSVYLINLSHPSIEPKEACAYIRRLPKGENASIFLLNDGEAPLKSFEEALSLGADGLYFHKSQMSLLLTNFPPKHKKSVGNGSKSEGYPTLSSRHFGASITLGGERELTIHGPKRDRHDSVRIVHNRDRVTGMSLGHQNRNRLSQNYTSESSLSVSDIEAALADADAQASMGKKSVKSPFSDQPQSVDRMFSRSMSMIEDQVLTPQMGQSYVEHKNKEIVAPLSLAFTSLKSSFIEDDLAPIPSLPWGAHFNITDVPFADFFGKVITHQLSLRVLVEEDTEGQSKWVELTISEGDIISVNASEIVVQFIQHLIAQGLISQSDADQILNEVYRLSDSKNQIDILIESLVDFAPQVIPSLDAIMEVTLLKVMYHLFELTVGSIRLFSFERPEEIRRFKVSSTRLLIDGIQNSMGKLRLYSLFGTPKLIPYFDKIGLYLGHLTEIEILLIRGAQGHHSIAEMAKDSGLNVIDALGLCYAFSLLGDFTLNHQSPLKGFYKRACTQDYYQLLSLSYQATDDEITEAWKTHRQWLSEQRGDPDLVTPLIDIINDAYCVLVHPPLRVRYLESLEKPIYSEMSIVPESYAPVIQTSGPEEISR